MRDNNYLGWFSFNALSFAVILSLLSVVDPLDLLANRRGAQFLAAALSLMATVGGFCAFKTGPGRVGGIGGAALLVVLGLWLSWTTLAGSPQPPAAGPPKLTEAPVVGRPWLVMNQGTPSKELRKRVNKRQAKPAGPAVIAGRCGSNAAARATGG
jgi:hypothetical protein